MFCILISFLGYCAFAWTAVIHGGVTTTQEYPYAVEYDMCMGTLISDRWVLTSAHCYNADDPSVRVLSVPEQRRTQFVKRSVLHPRYRLGDNFVKGVKVEIYATYDYLLLELSRPLKSVKYAQLGDGPELAQGTRITYPTVFSLDYNPNVTSPLYYGELFALSNEECGRRVQSFDPRSMMCAVGGPPLHTGVCYGDSGSGLIAEGRLVGVMSWVEKDAIDCGPDRTAVSATILTPEIKQWIRGVMAETSYHPLSKPKRKPAKNQYPKI